MTKRIKLRMKPIRHYATNGADTRHDRHMRFGSATDALLERVSSITQFAEAAIMILAYLLGLIKWVGLAPVIAANLTNTQRHTVASAARTLALNLELMKELSND